LQAISCGSQGKPIKRLHSANCAELFGIYEAKSSGEKKRALPLFEIALVFVRLDHIASFTVNPNHSSV
jgi:hypothetical protein